MVFHQITATEAFLPTPGRGAKRWVFPHTLSADYSRALEFPRDAPKKIIFRPQGLSSGSG